jgi:hypothetical protein
VVAKGVSSSLEGDSRVGWGKRSPPTGHCTRQASKKSPPTLNFTSGNHSERMAVTFPLGFPSHDFVSFIKLSKLLVTDRMAK